MPHLKRRLVCTGRGGGPRRCECDGRAWVWRPYRPAPSRPSPSEARLKPMRLRGGGTQMVCGCSPSLRRGPLRLPLRAGFVPQGTFAPGHDVWVVLGAWSHGRGVGVEVLPSGAQPALPI